MLTSFYCNRVGRFSLMYCCCAHEILQQVWDIPRNLVYRSKALCSWGLMIFSSATIILIWTLHINNGISMNFDSPVMTVQIMFHCRCAIDTDQWHCLSFFRQGPRFLSPRWKSQGTDTEGMQQQQAMHSVCIAPLFCVLCSISFYTDILHCFKIKVYLSMQSKRNIVSCV